MWLQHTPNNVSLSFLSLWDTWAMSSVTGDPHQSHVLLPTGSQWGINEQQCQMLCSQLLLPLQRGSSLAPALILPTGTSQVLILGSARANGRENAEKTFWEELRVLWGGWWAGGIPAHARS